MLATDNFLKSLNSNDTENYNSKKEDYDLDEVLGFWGNNSNGHRLRYSDGTEKIFKYNIS